jgi:hypothetical protein
LNRYFADLDTLLLEFCAQLIDAFGPDVQGDVSTSVNITCACPFVWIFRRVDNELRLRRTS